MKGVPTRGTALLPILFLLACAPADETTETGEMASEEMQTAAPAPISQAEMDAAHAEWMAAEQADDGARAGAQYAADAIFVSPRGTFEGQGAIQAMWTDAFGAQPGSAGTQLTAIKTGASGDLGYTLGRYTSGVSVAGSNGHYLTVTQRQPDGSVKIVAQISIADPPAEGN